MFYTTRPPAYNPNRPTAPAVVLTAPPLDNCAICQYSCAAPPQNDPKFPKVVVETGCHHKFHEYCMQMLMGMGANSNCPQCRRHLDSKEFTIVKLADRPKPPVPVPAPVRRAPPPSNPWWHLGEAEKSPEVASSTLWDAITAATDYIWPREIDPVSIETINREVDRVHAQINSKVHQQQEAMRVLLGQVASIGQDRSRNPVAMLEQVKNYHSKMISHANVYLRETDALIKKMQRVSNSL